MRIPFVRAALAALVALAACRTAPLAGRPLAPAAPADLAVGPDLTPPADMARCPPRFHDDPTPNAVRCGYGPSQPLCVLGPDVTGCYRGNGPRCGSYLGGPAIECDGPEDCAAGERCVLFIGEALGQDGVVCVAAGRGYNGGPFCHTDDDCPDGAACYEDTTEEQYFGGTVGVCRQRCD